LQTARNATKRRLKKKSEKIDGADRKLADQALKVFAQDGIAAAVGVARQIKDPIFRAKTFRRLAEDQTKLNDKYNILDAQTGWVVVSGAKSLPEPLPIEKIQAFENAVAEKNNADPMGKVVQDALPSPIGERIEVDPLVARLKADGDTVRAAVPLPGQGRIARAYYENNLYNSKFYEVAGNAGFADWQKSGAPEAIVIENGIVDLPTIYDAMRNDGLDDYIVRDGKTYYLRRPLVVGPKAALVVTGDDVEAVKMSTQSGAYIVVVGKLYFSDSKLIGWNDEKSEPMWAEYKDKRQFRPYLTSWSQSEMHIGNSEIVAIGYGNGKSYGISLSAGPNIWFKFGNDPHFQRPKATIVDNSIRNTLYGFYSYEADDVVLSGNEYIDNIVYGVDPHDRSHRLAIGYNTAYDTHKKHGIIISREVADSIIFGNLTFDNKGTGIMLDRDSNGTFVYGNTSFHNKQDGLTLFESDCEIVAANNIFENHGSGFRIRNSYNIGLFYNDLSRNGAAGVSAYDATLKGNPAHKTRDFDLDPYDEFTAIAAIGNKMEANNIGLGVEAIDGIFLKKNTFIDQSPKVLRGAMFRENPELLFRYDQKGNGVSVNATCPALAAPLYVQECKYRKDGTLAGDGLDYLIGRVKASACAKSTTTVKHVPHSEEDDAEE
jgi:parallel beta-helix repeat protein